MLITTIISLLLSNAVAIKNDQSMFYCRTRIKSSFFITFIMFNYLQTNSLTYLFYSLIFILIVDTIFSNLTILSLIKMSAHCLNINLLKKVSPLYFLPLLPITIINYVFRHIIIYNFKPHFLIISLIMLGCINVLSSYVLLVWNKAKISEKFAIVASISFFMPFLVYVLINLVYNDTYNLYLYFIIPECVLIFLSKNFTWIMPYNSYNNNLGGSNPGSSNGGSSNNNPNGGNEVVPDNSNSRKRKRSPNNQGLPDNNTRLHRSRTQSERATGINTNSTTNTSTNVNSTNNNTNSTSNTSVDRKSFFDVVLGPFADSSNWRYTSPSSTTASAPPSRSVTTSVSAFAPAPAPATAFASITNNTPVTRSTTNIVASSSNTGNIGAATGNVQPAPLVPQNTRNLTPFAFKTFKSLLDSPLLNRSPLVPSGYSYLDQLRPGWVRITGGYAKLQSWCHKIYVEDVRVNGSQNLVNGLNYSSDNIYFNENLGLVLLEIRACFRDVSPDMIGKDNWIYIQSYREYINEPLYTKEAPITLKLINGLAGRS